MSDNLNETDSLKFKDTIMCSCALSNLISHCGNTCSQLIIRELPLELYHTVGVKPPFRVSHNISDNSKFADTSCRSTTKKKKKKKKKKTNKKTTTNDTYTPIEDSDQPAHQCNLTSLRKPLYW